MREDDYHWLGNRDDPAVLAYLDEENRYAATVLARTKALAEQLYAAGSAAIPRADTSVPDKLGDYWYYWRQNAGNQYRVYARKRGALTAPEEVIVDVNALAAGHRVFRIRPLRPFKVSPDQRFVAVGVDTLGSEHYTIFIKDLRSGAFVDTIPNTSAIMEWAADSRTLLYTGDRGFFPTKLFRHTVGEPPNRDVLLYSESGRGAYVDVERTSDGRYLLLTRDGPGGAEMWYIRADQPTDSLRMLLPRDSVASYSVTHRGGDFVVLVDSPGYRQRLVRTPDTNLARTAWKEVYPIPDGASVEFLRAFRDHLVAVGREDGLPQIWVTDLRNGQTHKIQFPEPSYSIDFPSTSNLDAQTSELRFVYTSFVTPPTVVDYDMDTHAWIVRGRQQVRGFDPQAFHAARIWATGSDGVRIPISIVYQGSLDTHTSRPLILYGYGAAGISSDPTFEAVPWPLLGRGFVFAIAHVRGGGEFGPMWSYAGSGMRKRTSFSDFIAAAEHLIAQGYTASDRLVIIGGSSGGTLMGAVANMRPDLFRLVIAQAPYVDAVTPMVSGLDRSSPDAKATFEYVWSYSPYDNVRAQKYPAFYITSNMNDPRVQYWQAAKWTAKLRATKADDNILLLRTETTGGHSGLTGREVELRARAEWGAFVLSSLGLKE